MLTKMTRIEWAQWAGIENLRKSFKDFSANKDLLDEFSNQCIEFADKAVAGIHDVGGCSDLLDYQTKAYEDVILWVRGDESKGGGKTKIVFSCSLLVEYEEDPNLFLKRMLLKHSPSYSKYLERQMTEFAERHESESKEYL